MTQLAATAATISGDGSRSAAAGDPGRAARATARIAPGPDSCPRSGAASLDALRRRADRQERAQEGRRARRRSASPPPERATPEGPKRARRRPGAWRVVRWVLTALAVWVGSVDRALPVQRAVPAGPRRRRDALRAHIGRRRRIVSPTTVLILGSDVRPEGLARARRADERARALGLDPADEGRRRPQRQAVDPARHRRRHPRLRPEQDQRRLRARRRRRWRSGPSRTTWASTSTTSILVNFDKFPELVDAMGGVELHRRLRRLAHQRRLSQRRLHAAAEGRHDAHRRQAGARAVAHPKERVQPARGRADAPAPPAEGRRVDEEARALARRVPALAVGRLARPADDHLRHGRARSQRADRDDRHGRRCADAHPQAGRRSDAAGRRGGADRLRGFATAPGRALPARADRAQGFLASGFGLAGSFAAFAFSSRFSAVLASCLSAPSLAERSSSRARRLVP